jgi:CheY-like chemotaxis protein
MLAKDYRTRCSLDSIVIDDWVSFEGSEPLFDSVDFDGTSYTDFLAFAAQEEGTFEDSYYVLIMDKKWVNRTMLSQKVNNIHHAVCTCLETPEQVLTMMASARGYNATNNFDYIFIEVHPDNGGLETIKEIRRLGYGGRLIAVNYGNQATELANPDAADAAVIFPVPVRDLSKVLSTDSFEEVQTMQRTDSATGGVTLEDLDAAITYHAHVQLAVSHLLHGSLWVCSASKTRRVVHRKITFYSNNFVNDVGIQTIHAGRGRGGGADGGEQQPAQPGQRVHGRRRRRRGRRRPRG